MPEGEIHQFGKIDKNDPPQKGPVKIRQFGQGLYHTKVIKPAPVDAPVVDDDEDEDAAKKAKSAAPA